MTQFDGWNARYYANAMGGDALAHFRTPGSKNGVRRFQNTDGSWTPLGLKERRAREGFGKAEKKLNKAERKAARASRKVERIDRRKARNAAIKAKVNSVKEKIRKRSVKGLTDEELKRRIDRLNMEKQYKDLKGDGIVKTGMDLVNKYLERRDEKVRRQERAAQLKVNELNAKANIARSKADVLVAKSNEKIYNSKAKMNETQTNLVNAKKAYKEYKNSSKLLRAFKTRRAYDIKEGPGSTKWEEKRQRGIESRYRMETDRIKANTQLLNAQKAPDKSKEEPYVPGKHAKKDKKSKG